MAASTLQVTYGTLRADIGYYANARSDSSLWDASQVDFVERMLAAGLRKFYWGSHNHNWSFLKPLTAITAWSARSLTATNKSYSAPHTTITVATATFKQSMVRQRVVFTASGSTYRVSAYSSTTSIKVAGDATAEGTAFTMPAGDIGLPDAFGRLAGERLTYDDTGYSAVKASDTDVRVHRQTSPATGRPALAAVVPRIKPYADYGADGVTIDEALQQTFDLLLYPTPDQDYVLNFPMQYLPDALAASTNGVPLGGAEYGECIRALCLAEVDIYAGGGLKIAEADALLAAAVQRDRGRHATTGRNLDRSDMRRTRFQDWWPFRQVTGGRV